MFRRLLKHWHQVANRWTGLPAPTRQAYSRLSLEALEDRLVPTVTYHGGELLQHVQVQPIFFGTDWSTNATYYQQTGQLGGYLQYIVNSPYMDMLTNAGYNVDRGSYVAGRIYEVSLNKNYYLDDSTIQTDLQNLIDNPSNDVQAPNSNTLYVVFVEDNVAVEIGSHGPNSQTTFLGYHDSFLGNNMEPIRYAVITYPGGSVGNAQEPGLSAIDSMTETTSHELAEAVTDPDPGGIRAWYDNSYSGTPEGDEVGDICNGQITYLNGYAVQKIANKNDQPMTPVTQVASFTRMTVSATSVQQGDALTFTVDVSGSTGEAPTGFVDFTDGNMDLGTVALQSENTPWGPLGQASLTTTTLPAGSHSIVAHYFGDANNSASNSAAIAVTVTPVAVTTATTLTATPSPATAGQTVTFTAVVNTSSGTPTGMVTFMDGQTYLGGVTVQMVNGVAQASYSTNALTAGAHSITATYSGDSGHLSSTAALALNVTSPLPPQPPPPAPAPADPGFGQAAWQAVANDLTHSAEYYTNVITAAYQKYLGRAPDAVGQAYWLNLMQHGLSDERLEAGFIGSTEYIADHGGPGQGWVVGLYQDLLGRTPRADEVAYWMAHLNNGMSPQDVAYGFAASAEREGQRVTADYQQYLGRNPSPVEASYWVNQFLGGMDNESVIAGFISSQEFFQTQGQNNVHDWLFTAYQEILHQPPDAADESYWLGVLGN